MEATDKLLAALPLPALFLLAVLCVLVPLLLLRGASSKIKLRLPPSPPALPVIGHLHLLGTHPHQSLSNLSKTYGPLMLLRFGSVPAVIASTPAMARQILQTHDKTFASRPQPAVSKELQNCEGVVFTRPGPYWKLMRQIFATDLFAAKRIAYFRPVITEEVNVLLRSILDSPDNVPMRSSLHAATSHIISRMALGKRLADLTPVSTQGNAASSPSLVDLVVEAVFLVGLFNVGDYIPWLAWLDLQGCMRRSKAIADRLHIMFQEVIDGRKKMRRQTNNGIEDRDFLDVLLTATERENADVPIKDFNIRAVMMDMYGAGIDTSSVTTEWALYELLASPSKMKKLQEELEHVVGMSRLVQETDTPQLPYLYAVVKETLRLHPAVSLLVPHEASQECQVGGYDIPAGSLAYVNAWAIGRDPDVWENPLEFRPERFLGCNTDVRGQHFELIPFGSGRRACPGMLLGLTNSQFMLASLVHCFDWSTTDELNRSEKFGLVVTPEKPLVATAIPRLPKHLFELQACSPTQ